MAQTATDVGSMTSESVSEAVISAVADHTDSDPLSMDPLYDAVDPDALDALFERDRSPVGSSPTRVTFTYCGCEVTVAPDGSVSVSDAK